MRDPVAVPMAIAAHPGPSVTIDGVLARIDRWRGRPVAVRALPNGLTNANYRVDVDGQTFVVRIPGAESELLGVDRAAEAHDTRIAGALGVGAPVIEYLSEVGVMVTGFIHGRTLSVSDLQAPGMPARIARSLRRLHGGPRFHRDVDMLRLADHYLTVTERRGFPIPASYRGRLSAIRRLADALAVAPLPTAPCHNDLLPENYIDDGQQLWLVDWEYSGNNDPTFDLGNTARELDYDTERIGELCQAYFGAAIPSLLARVQLQTIVSDVAWTLWAAIQAAVSRIAFDFQAYGERRWARAEAALDSPKFGGWLAAVRLPGSAPAPGSIANQHEGGKT